MKVVQGYALFGLAGLAIGYVLATAYVQWAVSPSIGYEFLVLNASSFVKNWPEQAQHVALIVGLPAVLGLIFAGLFVTESLTEFGSTHWQTRAELKRNGFHEQIGRGFLLGKTGKPKSGAAFITSSRFPHCMVVAPTGRGKGVGFVIPNLLTFKGSTVTLDVKGENFEKTAKHRASIGDKVLRFAPTDFTAQSVKWNPLERIAKIEDPHQRMFELQKMANLFLQTSSANAESFLVGGRMAFVAAAVLAVERGKPTIGEVFDIINGGSAGMNEQFGAYATETQDKEARVMWESLAKNNDRTLTSYTSVLNTSGLDAWQNGRVKEVTSTSDFDFADIRKEATSIYLTVNSHDIEPNAGLIRLFFGDLIANLEHHEPEEDEPWPVMIILDEFHKLGKMPIVAESITTLRSYGARLAIITQTIPKLDEIYGENERRSLEGGAGIKVFMTPSEELTISSLSEACGMTTKRSVMKSRQAGIFQKTNISERTEEVPLLKEDDARRLDLSDVILVVDGDHPIKAKGIRYYEDRVLKPIFDAQQTSALPSETKEKEERPAETHRSSTERSLASSSEHEKDEEIRRLRLELSNSRERESELKLKSAETLLALSDKVVELTERVVKGKPLNEQEPTATPLRKTERQKRRKGANAPFENVYNAKAS